MYHITPSVIPGDRREACLPADREGNLAKIRTDKIPFPYSEFMPKD